MKSRNNKSIITNYCLVLIITLIITTMNVQSDKRTLFVGTWSANMYILQLETSTGHLSLLSKANIGNRPSFVTLNPSKTLLYAVNEIKDFSENSGALVVYDIQKNQSVNTVASMGNDPCFVMVDSTGEQLLFANYNDKRDTASASTYGVYSLQSNGSVHAQPSVVLKNSGHGPNPQRQDQSHPHQFITDHSNRFAFAVDLGSDRIYQYLFHPDATDKNILTVNPHAPYYQARAGSGPRHLAFHPSMKYVYLSHELDSTMSVLAFNSDEGTLSEVQVITMLPQEADPSKCSGAEVQVSPDGRFVYGSNRGDSNTFVIYQVDQHSGKLTLVGHQESGGDIPRYFTLDESGETLLAANQESNNIRVFKRDIESGLLKQIGGIDNIERPTCIALL
jgi:6-phosphogluconolactonase